MWTLKRDVFGIPMMIVGTFTNTMMIAYSISKGRDWKQNQEYYRVELMQALDHLAFLKGIYCIFIIMYNNETH